MCGHDLRVTENNSETPKKLVEVAMVIRAMSMSGLDLFVERGYAKGVFMLILEDAPQIGSNVF